MCCLNMGINLKILKMSPLVICVTLYTERIADLTYHFANAFIRENVEYGYDIVMTL